jgi:hypothetical protein
MANANFTQMNSETVKIMQRTQTSKKLDTHAVTNFDKTRLKKTSTTEKNKLPSTEGLNETVFICFLHLFFVLRMLLKFYLFEMHLRVILCFFLFGKIKFILYF